MERLNIEYLRYKTDLLYEIDDDEFLDWLECEDCAKDDYLALVQKLEQEEMYERVSTTLDYIAMMGRNIHRH